MLLLSEKKSKVSITEKTTVSIGLIIAILTGSISVSKIYFMADANGQDIQRITTRQEKYNEDISKIREDIATIKQRLLKGE